MASDGAGDWPADRASASFLRVAAPAPAADDQVCAGCSLNTSSSRLPDRPADHDHVMAQAHQGPKQGFRIGHVRQAAPAFPRRLSDQRFKPVQALACPHRQGAQIGLRLIVRDRHRFHLLGQQPRRFGRRLHDRPRRPRRHDQDGDQKPDGAAETDFQHAVGREAERPQGRAPLALSSTMMAVIGAMRKLAEYAAMNESGATATTRASALVRSSACGIAKATALP